MISTAEKRTLPFQVLDVSFSSYLNDSQDTFIRKLAPSSQIQISSLVPVPVPPQSAYIGKNKVEDGEIGIFGAEKYFTEAIDDENSVIPNKGNNPNSTCQQEREQELVVDEYPVKLKTQPGTPSVRSEASWNSRSALLQTNPRNRKEVNKVSNIKSFLAVLGCNCNGKNSVEVSEKNCQDRVVQSKEINKPVKAGNSVVRTAKSLSSRWAEEEIQSKKLDHPNSKSEDGFSFPVISSKTGDQAVVKIQLQEEKETVRNSLEVFGSPIMEKAKKSFSLERKLTMLNWDGVTTRVQDIEIPPNQNVMYNDAESDASSDLFEIESFSTNGNPFPGRLAPEEMSKPSNGYAPSEASIDWSVATASAADASVISDYKQIRNGTAKSSSMIAWSMKIDATGKEVVQKKAPGILSGCKSLKSVRVAGDEYRTTTTIEKAAVSSPRGRLRLESGTPITKFQAETKLTGLDSRSRGQNGFDTRSHSPHTSHLLYIQ